MFQSTENPIGIAKGPGETAYEYTFITADPDQRVRYGEFVYYYANVEGERRQVLGRVTQRVPLRLYPDALLADASIRPTQMADLLGLPNYDEGLFEIVVAIVGYYDPVMGFVNPRVQPPAGEPIYIASDEMLRTVLCSLQLGEVGAVHVGSLLSRAPGQVPVVMDAHGFTSTHLAIIASTGSGKSYLAGVILEELLRPHNRAAVLVIDPHAEYDTLVDMQDLEAFRASGYRPVVKIVRPKDIRVRTSSLNLGDLRYLLPNLSERMHHLLSRAYHAVRREYGERWRLAHLRMAVRRGLNESPVTDPEADETEDPSVGALIWRINQVLGGPSSIFDDDRGMALEELFRPGQCTVLQLNEIAEREQRIIVATILRRLNQARMNTVRNRTKPGDELYLPYPAFVLIEEAHNYAPAGTEVITTGILKQILSEGRKFGVAIGLISQRPGRLDADVLSQCMTQCIMRIVNPVDQARVRESVESVGRDLLAELPALSKGQVIIAGASVNTPLLVRVRKRLTRHGAEDPRAPEAWQEYFSEERQHQRERDEALPWEEPPRRGEDRLFR